MKIKTKKKDCFVQARYLLTKLCNIFDEAFLFDVSIVISRSALMIICYFNYIVVLMGEFDSEFSGIYTTAFHCTGKRNIKLF